jgi:hypothetical protein
MTQKISIGFSAEKVMHLARARTHDVYAAVT